MMVSSVYFDTAVDKDWNCGINSVSIVRGRKIPRHIDLAMPSLA
jgi:hypothetical protein